MNVPVISACPSRPLRRFISHYWLSLDNTDSTHTVLPDGAIDIVIEYRGSSVQSLAYGTSTSSAVVALEKSSHYLGIRFKPGQGRHFIKAAAKELTDHCEPTEGLLSFSLGGVLDAVASPRVFARLDAILENHAAILQPAPAGVDEVIAMIENGHGTVAVEEAAAAFGKSRRQLERVFLETVGISPKLFSAIVRFRHAATLVQRSTSLAAVAFEAGYFDQSHMSHEFRRLAGVSPAMLARGNVAFLQDPVAAVSR